MEHGAAGASIVGMTWVHSMHGKQFGSVKRLDDRESASRSVHERNGHAAVMFLE